jgi:large subunit ribosomal protein L29
MKNEEIRDLSDKELLARIKDERLALQKQKLNHAISPEENPNRIRANRKLIARLLTEQNKRKTKTVQS